MASSVVLAFFPDEVAADSAAESLKAWDKLDDDVKLNAIGVLVLDDKGKVKTHKVGSRSVAKGVGIGVVLAVLAPPVSLLGGVLGGAAVGALHHKGLGLPKEEREALAADLATGKAAVGVLAKEDEVEAVTAKLAELGGTVRALAVSDEALAEAADAAAADPA
jgi:uncharacterized membrane protein